MKKILLALTALLCHAATISAQHLSLATGETIVTFRFPAGKDMFYIPWGGNHVELERLYSLVDEYRAEITAGRMPVYVDGYSASMRDDARNRELVFIRTNRVKSELITHKGLAEDNFVTKNYTAAYTAPDGTVYKDMVMVTLRIPTPEKPQPEVKPEPRKEEPRPEPEPEPKPEPVAEQRPEPQPELAGAAPRGSFPYCFAVRTNLLYDAFLVPTLGVEWRVNPSVGVKLDGSYSYWGGAHGKVQKIWLLNPEVRRYTGDTKRFYLGASANFGEYNIYKGMAGGLFSGDTGYQGKLWSAGLTAGYQLYLSRSFSLDFNIGLGYTNLEYDTFILSNETRVYQDRDQSKDFWGPTQAGVSLIWTIGGNK